VPTYALTANWLFGMELVRQRYFHRRVARALAEV